MIVSNHMAAWLEHRCGGKELEDGWSQYNRKAVELNRQGPDFIKTHGRREFRGFVGFIDLVGFSSRAKGKRPGEIAAYLKPFLERVVDLAARKYCLVDKTIGDEVMFVLPDTSEEGGPLANLLIRRILGGLRDLHSNLGNRYPFRIGLAYGNLLVDQIEGKGYSEWTTFGEPANLAKRLHELPEVSPEQGVWGAFGILLSNTEAVEQFDSILSAIIGVRFTYKVLSRTMQLDGVSDARCALLIRQQEGRND